MSNPAEVEMVERPPASTFTTVDERLLSHFEAAGYSISWQPEDEKSLSMLYTRGFRCVNIEDLKEVSEELASDLVDTNYINDKGRLQRDDCVLMYQPLEKRQEEVDFELHLRRIRESGPRSAQEVDEFVQANSRSVKVVAHNTPSSDDVVHVAKDLKSLGGSGE